ncbi:MAG: DUF89 family protein [Phycisphaerae bacterium]|nr:DUF89 family protein [Phycisphaerae bacterium]
MHVYLDCFPCFLRQTLAAARFVTDDEAIHAHVVDQVLGLLRCTDARQTPPAIGQQIHRLIRQATGNPDPYRKKKQSSNRLALRLYPQLKDEIRGSATPLETAVRLAIAGNVIDFGICHSLDAVALPEAIEKEMFFVLKAKCPVLAADLGCDIGQMILRRSHTTGRVVPRGRKEQTDARL